MAPVPSADPALCAALAADLRAADFHAEALRRMWGDEADDAFGRGVRDPILRALGDRRDPLATLGRLLILALPQPRSRVDIALPTVGAAGLVALGLAAQEGETLTPVALLHPQSFVDADGVGEWWIASDLDETVLGTALPEDHVLGVGGASRTLAELVIPATVDRALDLGTGCGIQALLLARHAREVVATDISARALAYAAFNAELNGVANIVFRRGSLFEPVAGEEFDLIVSNPPFVITPRAEAVPSYEYRDGGLVGDALVERVVRALPAHLAPGGVAQLLGNWESRGGVAGLDRVRSWVAEGMDAWVVERDRMTPTGYAELWIRDGGTTPRDDGFSPLLGAWLDDFAAREVEAVGFGSILLRRPRSAERDARARQEFVRIERITGPLSAPGRALGEGIAAVERLAEGLPATLLCAPDVTEARHYLPGAGDPQVIELRQGGGFGRVLSVDPALAAFVGACDGELTVAQIVQALADLFEVPVAELYADLEPRLRRLTIDGFLRPAED